MIPEVKQLVVDRALRAAFGTATIEEMRNERFGEALAIVSAGAEPART